MATAMFMNVDGIPGESTDQAHPQWIELQGYEHGLVHPGSGTSGTGVRADFQDFSVLKAIDSATAELNIFSARGQQIPRIEVEVCQTTGGAKHTFMKYTLENAIVRSITTNGTAENDSRPVETVNFRFTKLTWEYTPVDQAGAPGTPIVRAWNLATNQQE